MTQTFDVRIYKSGNSKVFTIPTGVPIEVGEIFQMTVSDNNMHIKKKKSITTKEKLEDLKKVLNKLGTLGLTKGMNAEELDDYLEGIYD